MKPILQLLRDHWLGLTLFLQTTLRWFQIANSPVFGSFLRTNRFQPEVRRVEHRPNIQVRDNIMGKMTYEVKGLSVRSGWLQIFLEY